MKSKSSAMANLDHQDNRTCLFTDIVGSTTMTGDLGHVEAKRLINRTFELFKQCLVSSSGVLNPKSADSVEKYTSGRIVQDTGDGVFADFTTVTAAVETALRFQWLMAQEKWEPRLIEVRMGIASGDVSFREDAVNPDHEIPVGEVTNRAARIMTCAVGGQILISESVSAQVRIKSFVHPFAAIESDRAEDLKLGYPELGWVRYDGDGVDDDNPHPLLLTEVGPKALLKGALLAKPEKCQPCDRQGILLKDKPQPELRPFEGMVVGSEKGNWVLERFIAKGGFGEAWLARNPNRLGEQHVRVLKFPNDPGRLRSFRRELELADMLKDHKLDGIVEIEHYETGRPVWLSTRFYKHGSLLEWVRKHPEDFAEMTQKQRIDFVIKLCRIVHGAHQIGIVHKDIKPGNVFIADEASGSHIAPVLADFGIGAIVSQELREKYKRNESRAVTIAGDARTGTEMYCPPEYMERTPISSEEAAFFVKGDVYALGVLLYQLLIGDFNTPWKSAQECERRIRDRPDTDNLDSHLNPFIRKAILQALDAESYRYGSAEEFGNRLEQLEDEYKNARETKQREENEALRRRSARNRKIAFVAATIAILISVLSVQLKHKSDIATTASRLAATERDRAIELVDKVGATIREPAYEAKSTVVSEVMKTLLNHAQQASATLDRTDKTRAEQMGLRVARIVEWLGGAQSQTDTATRDHYLNAVSLSAEMLSLNPKSSTLGLAHLNTLLLARRWVFTRWVFTHWEDKKQEGVQTSANEVSRSELEQLGRHWSESAITTCDQMPTDSEMPGRLDLHRAFAHHALGFISSAYPNQEDSTKRHLGKAVEIWREAVKQLPATPWSKIASAVHTSDEAASDAGNRWLLMTDSSLGDYQHLLSADLMTLGAKAFPSDHELAMTAIDLCTERATVATAGKNYTNSSFWLKSAGEHLLRIELDHKDDPRWHQLSMELWHANGHYQEKAEANGLSAENSFGRFYEEATWLSKKNAAERLWKEKQLTALKDKAGHLLLLGVDEASKRAAVALNEAIEIRRAVSSTESGMQFDEGLSLARLLYMRSVAVSAHDLSIADLNTAIEILAAQLAAKNLEEVKRQQALTLKALVLQLWVEETANQSPDISTWMPQCKEGIGILDQLHKNQSENTELLGALIAARQRIVMAHNEAHKYEDALKEAVSIWQLASSIEVKEGLLQKRYLEAGKLLGITLVSLDRLRDAQAILNEALDKGRAFPMLGRTPNPFVTTELLGISNTLSQTYYQTSQPLLRQNAIRGTIALLELAHPLWLQNKLSPEEVAVYYSAGGLWALDKFRSLAEVQKGTSDKPTPIDQLLTQARLISMSRTLAEESKLGWWTLLVDLPVQILATEDGRKPAQEVTWLPKMISVLDGEVSSKAERIRPALLLLCDLAMILENVNRRSDAEAVLQAAEQFGMRHGDKASNDPEIQRALASAQGTIADRFNQVGDTEKLIFWSGESLKHRRQLAKLINLKAEYDLPLNEELRRLFQLLWELHRRGYPSVLTSKLSTRTKSGYEHQLFSGAFIQVPQDPGAKRYTVVTEADVMEAKKKVHAAETEFNRNKSNECRENLSRAYSDLAYGYLHLKKWTEAEDWSRKSLAISPEWIRGQRNLTSSLLFQGKIDEAVKLCTEMCDQSSNKQEAYDLLDDFQYLRQAGIKHPDQAQFVRLVFEKTGAADLARRQKLLESSSKDKSTADTKQAEAASIHAKTNSTETAAKLKVANDEAAQAKKDLSHAYSGMSDGEVLRRSWKEAESHARGAIQLDPANEYAHGNLANALLLQGKSDDALFIYSAHWLEPVDGWTLGESVLQDFDRLEAIGITHPDMARVKTEMAKLTQAAATDADDKSQPSKQ